MSVPMRNSDIAALYFRRRLEDGGFDWEHFTHAPISSYISLPEIQYFDYIATSAKLAGKSKRYKIDMMSEVLRPKGFIYMAAGTNRVVFRNDYDQSFLLKIGFDSTGVNDSTREFYNQEVLKPFVPKMFDVEEEKPYAVEVEGRQLIQPIEKYGVKLLSIGFFVNPDTATLWRRGMASNALKQLIGDANWGELDYFILDTPPGTSDILLTLLQTLAITGAVIVSTPQKVALADARKGIDMYQNDKVKVPILGLVENMAWFTPAELPQNKYFIFGKEGCKNLASEMNLPLLAQIPVVESICESGDAGTPAALNTETMTGLAFINLAQAVVTVVNRRNKEQAPTNIVKVKR